MLDRDYFTECFEQSANTTTNFATFRLAILFFVMAAVFFMLETKAVAAWFLLALGAVELLSIRYKRGWWVARQMISRAAGSTVNLRIDEQGIFTESTHNQLSIHWEDIVEIKATEKGFVIVHVKGVNYLSKKGLGDEVLGLLNEKVKS